jgi:hypothetical protein
MMMNGSVLRSRGRAAEFIEPARESRQEMAERAMRRAQTAECRQQRADIK